MAALARTAPLPDPSQIPSDFEPTDFEFRLERLLRLVDAEPTDPVGVAGPEALDLMCALARRGFDRVEAAQRCTCRCADQACALLIVSGASADAIAATTLAVSGMLRPGGRLAVMAHAVHGPHERRRLGNLLAHRGFRYREDDLDGPILIATKPGPEDL